MSMLVLLEVAGLAVSCALALFVSLLRILQVERLMRQVRCGAMTAAAAYERYMLKGPMRWLRRSMGAVVVVYIAAALLFIANPGHAFDAYISSPMVSELFGLYGDIDPFIFIFSVPVFAFCMYWLYMLVTALFADPPIQSKRRGREVCSRDTALPYFKQMLARLPGALLIECLAVCMLFGFTVGMLTQQGTLMFLASLFCLGCFIVEYWRIKSVRLLRWYVPTRCIEDTEWKGLYARAEAWAALMGVRLRAIYVRSPLHSGIATTRCPQVLGTKNGCTLFLDEAFLSTSEWRQQDALICQHLAFAKTVPVPIARVERFALAGAVGMVVALALIGVIATSQAWITASFTVSGPSIFSTAFNAFIALLLLELVAVAIGSPKRRLALRNRITDADAAALQQTGDPCAMIAMLNTLAVTTDLRPVIAWQGYPSLAFRASVADTVARKPGPRAPWAAEPVPSVKPVETRDYMSAQAITVPLTDEARSAVPQPVPTAAYARIG